MLRRPNCVVTTDLKVGTAESSGQKSFRRIFQITGIVAALSTAACASGGGSSSMPSGSSVAATTSGGSSGNSGNSDSVGIPAPGSFGPSPVPSQFATPGGPTLNGGNGIFPAPNTQFPVLSSSLQVTSTGLSPVISQGATLTVVSSSSSSSTYQISVPSVGLNATMQITPQSLATSTISYVDFGDWQQQTTSGVLTNFTEWVFGYETPPTSMPTTGTASFSGAAQGTVFTPGTPFVGTIVNGMAAFSVNFASGSVTGALNQMQYVNPTNPGSSTAPNYLPWNDVSVNASIAAGTNQFGGSTAVTSTPQSPLSLKASATGQIGGVFYGPSAQALGGIWSLSDGTNSVLGGVGAGR